MLVLIVIVGLVITGLVVWQRTVSSYRSEVRISLARPIRCDGAKVSSGRSPFDHRESQVITVTPDMDCAAVVRYTNLAPVSVHLGTATFDLFGPGTGWTVMMGGAHEQLAPENIRVHGRLVAPLDAIFHLDRTLAAGQSFTVTYRLRYQRFGCSDGARWASNIPTVEDSALGLSGTVTGNVRFAFRAGATGTCPNS